ncbi:MAG TPA: DsbA family protein [Bryobacteraceae bacterium]|nr:DsbA family protein [Bryobacteraceae bacterium]
MFRALSLFTLVAVALWSAEKAPARKSAFDKTVLESYVRHLFVWGSQIKVEISDPKPSLLAGFDEVEVHASAGQASADELLYISKDGQKIVRGNVFDVAQNPFKPQLDKIHTDLQPSMGTPGAPVVLVLFSDFECPYCKDEAKTLRTNLLSTYPKEVRLYFEDMPLSQIHPWAMAASIAGRCIFRQNPNSFWDYFDWIYEHQADITADNLKSKILEFVKDNKDIDSVQLDRCMDSKATQAEIEKNMAQAKALAVNGTPTVFVNGRQLMGQAAAWANLRPVIDYEIEYQKTAKNAGEDCGCEVKLPAPALN